MSRLKIKKLKRDRKIVGTQFRRYIDFIILACCFIIAFNIHPSSNIMYDEKNIPESHTMIYIFHDYEGNEYIMNDFTHGVSNTWDYLFEDEVPDELKGEEVNFTDSVSLSDLNNNGQGNDGNERNDSEDIKNNQVSFNDIMSDLGVDSQDSESLQSDTNNNTDTLVISIGGNRDINDDNTYYTVEENNGSGNSSSLVIEKINSDNQDGTSNTVWNNNAYDIMENGSYENDNLITAKVFTFVEEGWVLPTLTPRNDLFFSDSNQAIDYDNINGNGSLSNEKSGITIIEDYADCMTPWGYKIVHGDSVLAYKQMDNAPGICNIERRFCWKGKLSGTYTQQGCSVNNNYTYEQRGQISNTTMNTDNNFKGSTRQNSDGSVTVKDSEIGGSFVFDKPNNIYSDFDSNNASDNVRVEGSGVEQTSRSYPDCTAPRGEKVKHGQFIQAFKHSNGFSDSPCEMQIRLCTMGELMGTYTESTCKTRDTSFIDWINGSPTRKTYSKEKLELVKKQMAAEEAYYEKIRENGERSTSSDALDRILRILDQD